MGEASVDDTCGYDSREDHYDAFTKKHYSQIISKLEIDEDVLKFALDEITKLNPKPGGSGVIQEAVQQRSS